MKIDCERETYLMTMQMMLRFLFFAAHIFHSCGKVILLRGESHHIESSISERKYICLSEDDGSALVWNDDLDLRNNRHNRNDFQFHSSHLNNAWINCKMNDMLGCLESWDRRNWSITHSIRTPMGPVFDRRWEEFQEDNLDSIYSFKTQKRYPHFKAISVSIRSKQNVNIIITPHFYDPERFLDTEGSFYIGIKYDSMDFTLQYCVIDYRRIPQCSSNMQRKKLLSFSRAEWRTFVISWNYWEQTVSVYDTNNNNTMLTLQDRQMYNSRLNILAILISIQIEKEEKMLYRLHEYNFLYTNDKNASLMSPVYTFNTHKICIQLSLGLCAECDADVVMIDFTTHQVLQSVTAKGSINAAIHGLPMWQLVKLNESFSTVNYSGSVKIHVIPKLTKPTHNPLWAIADVHECPIKESFRRGVISQKKHDSVSWPNVTCQKLSFNENTVVSSLSRTTNSIDQDHKICSEGIIGPECSFSCKHDLNSSANCNGTAMCYTSGCICSPGFQGDTCSELCDDNWYENICNSCDSCKYSESFKCYKRPAECLKCVNSLEMLYVPPLCHIGIKKPTVPEIVSVTYTSIETKLPIVWKEKYEQIMIKYLFTIKGENNYTFSQSWNRLFHNTTHLNGYFSGLNSGSLYSVNCILIAENAITKSKWESVETDCEPVKTFNVLSTENSIITNWLNTSDQLFPCPAHWYCVTIQNRNTGEIIRNSTVITFPHQVSDLPSFTPFNVIVSHQQLAHTIKHSYMFVTHIRTLQSASTRLLDLQYFANSSTQVTLKWKPPNHLNILLYEITLKNILYYGCEDFNLPTPVGAPIKSFTNKTEYLFSDLHPYASYTAQVTASKFPNSSYYAEITFDTKKSDIPTEVFTELKAQN